MFSLGHTKFLVEINYKSGIQKRFWCYSFTKNDRGVSYHACTQHRSIDLYSSDLLKDSIESIWTLEAKRGLLGAKE
jgi:hypothetical protein